MLHVMPIFGTRPESIKMAPIIRVLEASPGVQVTVVVTAQHRALMDDVLTVFDIRPALDLDLMRDDQSPTGVASAVLFELEPLLRSYRPDWVLVQGDTTTVMAAAIAAHYSRVMVGHVEAGLRSFDRANPFPEEMNRVVTGHIADLHFAPTDAARGNLLREGIPADRILVTGNTVIDALRLVTKESWSPPFDDPLARLPVGLRWILVTAHRRENFGQPIRDICHALLQLANRGDVHLVFPVHPNPNIHGPVYEILAGNSGITLLPPVDYRRFAWLLAHAALVLTDSGGIQEEAPSVGKPVLILRETTERPEAIEAGSARLVGTTPERIIEAAAALLDNAEAYSAMACAGNPYGDGFAAQRIVAFLLGKKQSPWQVNRAALVGLADCEG